MEATIVAENEIQPLIQLSDEGAHVAFTQAEPVVLQKLLDMIEGHIDAFPGGDVATPEGRESIRAFAFRVTKSKTFLEGLGKKVADDVKKLPKVVDANRRMISEKIEGWRDELRQPLTDWEAAEKARVDRHMGNVQTCIDASAASGSAEHLRALLARVNAVEVSEEACEEFLDSYQRSKADAVDYLTRQIAEAERAEAERAELEALRKEKAERDAADAARKAEEERKAREAKIAEEAARAAEERVRKEAEENQLRAVEEAERRGRKAAMETMPAAAQAAPVASNPDRDFQAQVNRQVAAAIMDAALITEAAAKKVVAAIVKGAIPNVSISYAAQKEAA